MSAQFNKLTRPLIALNSFQRAYSTDVTKNLTKVLGFEKTKNLSLTNNSHSGKSTISFENIDTRDSQSVRCQETENDIRNIKYQAIQEGKLLDAEVRKIRFDAMEAMSQLRSVASTMRMELAPWRTEVDKRLYPLALSYGLIDNSGKATSLGNDFAKSLSKEMSTMTTDEINRVKQASKNMSLELADIVKPNPEKARQLISQLCQAIEGSLQSLPDGDLFSSEISEIKEILTDVEKKSLATEEVVAKMGDMKVRGLYNKIDEVNAKLVDIAAKVLSKSPTTRDRYVMTQLNSDIRSLARHYTRLSMSAPGMTQTMMRDLVASLTKSKHPGFASGHGPNFFSAANQLLEFRDGHGMQFRATSDEYESGPVGNFVLGSDDTNEPTIPNKGEPFSYNQAMNKIQAGAMTTNKGVNDASNKKE